MRCYMLCLYMGFLSCLCAVSGDKVAHLLYSSFLAAGGCVVCVSSQLVASVFEDSLYIPI